VLELASYAVKGFRALADTDDIPVGAPTILTGANDGGKTTALGALQFLLDGPVPSQADYTVIGTTGKGGTEPLHAEQIVVTGKFAASEDLRDELELKESIELRRVAMPGSSPRFEMLDRVAADQNLRNLNDLKLAELKALGESRGVEPSGKANARFSWLEPLEELATAEDQVDDWTEPAAELIRHLPRCLVFSSIDEPDPEGQIKQALKVAFDQVLDDTTYTGPVREAEEKVRERIVEEAKDLCDHIGKHCPELSEITVVPDIAFREGFRSVEVRASRGNTSGIALEKSGAGRRRRINLAVWEWVEKLLEARPDSARGVVIAYDEPDTHLDYGHQRELVTLIQSQCARAATQMIVATHSLNLIDRVSITDVVHLRLEGDYTKVERLLGEEHEKTQNYLADVSAAMGLRNSVLLHERCFVGVEGPTETQALPLLFRVATGMSVQSAGIALIAGNSNEGALRVAQFLQQHERRLAFIVDADSASGTTRKLFRKEKLESIGIEPSQVHYLGAQELEDLFSDEQWVVAANENWPRDDGRAWEVGDLAPVHHGSKFSSALMNIIRGGSSSAPRGKPGYLVALAGTLSKPEEVPEELRNVFGELMKLAAAA
jgi:putative ATP-dependent endonuclease of OLD family